MNVTNARGERQVQLEKPFSPVVFLSLELCSLRSVVAVFSHIVPGNDDLADLVVLIESCADVRDRVCVVPFRPEEHAQLRRGAQRRLPSRYEGL